MALRYPPNTSAGRFGWGLPLPRVVAAFFAVIAAGFALTPAYAASSFDPENKASWKHLSQGRYIFSSAGVAFIDQKLGSRTPSSGTVTFTSDHKDKSSFVATVGVGAHIHRYFAFETSYSYFTGAEYKGTLNASSANFD
ncbi:MAG: hypothetical protein J4F41_07050, partial [Alphaproteobacteria bacterium]|nr:hypothetical protein [Alphaproteobacteria bacterium]